MDPTRKLHPPPGRVGAVSTRPSILNEIAFMTQGVCQDYPQINMFPDPRSTRGVARALALCELCPVKTVCADYALTNHVAHGVWGGLTEEQRRGLSPHPQAFGGSPAATPGVCDLCAGPVAVNAKWCPVCRPEGARLAARVRKARERARVCTPEPGQVGA